ncbi:putative carbonyl reductase [Corynespora cassiicola Philippines]|uniref:Putative carbonyl reductase n=1 Tax=Corynespora cassiicola Philippines TaxID=1448308 RepID=A0A2T2N1S0_CORCC|nr:putative carbonyl reductase [Corynespora cassiicola Philippines]
MTTPGPWNPLEDMPALDGKVAVVTGSNSSIGLAIVRLLAVRGAKVYFTTRSEAKAQKVLESLLSSSPEIKRESLQWLPLDLTDLKSIHAASDELKSRESKVDILINNAAASTLATDPVGSGWEQHMAVNFIGPFVFVNRILPLLKSSSRQKDADVRIVSISSTAQSAMLPASFRFEFDSPTVLSRPVSRYPWQWRYLLRFLFGFDIIRYAVSKAATFIFAQELQRQLDNSSLPILSLAVHPGEVATEGVMKINTALLAFIARLTFSTPDQGAATPLFAATAKEVRAAPGKYIGRLIMPVGKIGVANPIAQNERQVKGLWENTTREVNRELMANCLPPLAAW